jgi:hypothetical protein
VTTSTEDQPPTGEVETGPVEGTRISQMLIDNAQMIEEEIERLGASAVSEFFISVGTSLAVAYDIHEEQQSPAVTNEEETP